MSERWQLEEQLCAADCAVAAAVADRDDAKAALKEFDKNPPYGTLVTVASSVSGEIYAIRVRRNAYSPGSGSGWRVIHSDGSGGFYSDTSGGLAAGGYKNSTEVYRP